MSAAFLCGCEKNDHVNRGGSISRDARGTFNSEITKHLIEGHEYFSRYNGGIIHSESCPSEKHIKEVTVAIAVTQTNTIPVKSATDLMVDTIMLKAIQKTFSK